MSDHVKKILNRAYLEDKPYNDIVLHLEKEMRLNGLGAQDEVTLVPLNKIEPAQTKPETKQVGNTTQNTKKVYCSYCNKFGHYKAECRKLKCDKWQQTQKNIGQTNYSAGKPPKCDTCGKPHKTEDCWNGANSANDPQLKRHNTQERKTDSSAQQTTTKSADEQKTNYAAPVLWGNSRREGVFTRRPPTIYTTDTTAECTRTPTEDWLRQQAIASIKKQPPEKEQEATFLQDQDYRSDHQNHTNPLSQPTINTKELSDTTQIDHNEKAPDDNLPSQKTEEDTNDITKISISLNDFPTALNSIKEYITERDGDTYIPLHSTIVLKNRRMLYLPLEFGEITTDSLVDSRAFINAMSWSDYNVIKMNSDNCVTKEYPQPPFKIECANSHLEQPIATADIQLNIGTYTFTDTFVILSKTSFPIIGLNFMRNHQAVIDTANGIITFPHVEMTLAKTDEKKNCNPKPLQIMAEGNQTLQPRKTTTVNAIVITTNAIDITGAVQPLPQFDETATIIVAPALATAHNKRINLRIADLTEFLTS